MAGPTRETATPPDDLDKWWIVHVLPVCRDIICRSPHLFRPELVAKVRREMGLVGDATTESEAA